MYTCAMCGNRSCRTGELDNTPLNCPCNEEEQEKVKELYHDEDNKKLAYYSAQTEAEGYCRKTRLEEIMDFANKCSYKKAGAGFLCRAGKRSRRNGKAGCGHNRIGLLHYQRNPIGFPCPHAQVIKEVIVKNWVNRSKSSIIPTS